MAFVVGLFLTSTVCLVLFWGFTDAKFMHDAMSGLHPGEVNSYSPICMNPARTRLNVVAALTPNFIAVALSVIYAFGGKRWEMRLSKHLDGRLNGMSALGH